MNFEIPKKSKDIIYGQLNKWISDKEKIYNTFFNAKMFGEAAKCQAEIQAYWNVLTFLQVNEE